MARRVIRISVEDHVSPCLRALADSVLLIEMGAKLPPLPASPVVVEQGETASGPYLKMIASDDLVAWLVTVRRMSVDPRRRLVVADEVDPMAPDDESRRGPT